MKEKIKKIVASLLILTVLLSFTSCFNRSKSFVSVSDNENDTSVSVGDANNKITETELIEAINKARQDSGLSPLPMTQLSSDGELAELTRKDLELVVDIIDSDVDVDTLDDDKLHDIVDELLNSIDKTDDTLLDSDIYDEDGSMKVPFDEAYPELIEDELIEFSDEAILVKVKNSYGSKPKNDMKSVGVAALEEIVPLEMASWYKAKLKKGTDVQSALESLRELKSVLLAEYDYKIKPMAIDNYDDLPEDKKLDGNKNKKEQWYLNHFGIPKAFKHMKTDGGVPSVIVAVIDTGVDYDHEDLADNMWKNTAEIPDNNVDDDNNGYVDDYYGVNIVSGTGNGDDDNGHGTHVAGIIAAQNNNIGTVGIAYNVKIMTVKAASEYFLQSDIAKAILYAYENGAEVINMSFGGASCSIAVQDAIATAYTRCVLVASAGNDGMNNEPSMLGIPNYPAALTYVLGVMSVDNRGVESEFTSWDGVKYNGYEYELYAPGDQIMSTLPVNRYGVLSGTSMAAPVVSAFAAILRSEFVDRDMYPTKFIYGQLASTSDIYGTCFNEEKHGEHNLPQVVDLYSALTKMPTPNLGVNDYAIFDTKGFSYDTANKNNGDGVIDAGETIALGFTLSNRWGMSQNSTVTIDANSIAGIPNQYITIHNPTIDYGSIGTYSTGDCGKIYTDEMHTGWQNPFYITISEDCPNDYIFKLNINLNYKNGLDDKDKTLYFNEEPISIDLTVRNGVILPTIIDTDMTLTADNLYIIPNTTVIENGTTVTVEAGTNIQFWSNDAEDPYADKYVAFLRVDGKFLVNGTKENPVNIYPSDIMSNYVVEFGASDTGYISLKYANIINFLGANNSNTLNYINYADHCTFRFNYSRLFYRQMSGGVVYDYDAWGMPFGFFKNIKNSIFYKIGSANHAIDINYHINGYALPGIMDRCIFVDCGLQFYNEIKISNCVFLGNTFNDQSQPDWYTSSSYSTQTNALPIVDYTDVLYNESTDTTYIETIHSVPDELCKKLGLSYVALETEEEAQWLYENGLSTTYYTGIRYDHDNMRYCWDNGTEIADFLDPEGLLESTIDEELYINLFGSIHVARYEIWQCHLYELKGDATNPGSGPAYTAESFVEAVKELDETYRINNKFYNNAILNRISTDTDVTHWMRILSLGEMKEKVSFGGNYWGTTNETMIGHQIVDYTDYINYSHVIYSPYLTEAPEDTFPFVTSVNIFNEDGEQISTVSSEKVKIHITFNRDMDTDIPLNVMFGSSYPYGDYQVEGEYVSARVWEATYKFDTLIENGTQYFTISNGCSATDDLELCTDCARFGFTIDTAAAQALIMQGEATDTGINLHWTQDDFDTLMGYNVYRSTSEDGLYTRINSTIIPAEQMEFFDATVEPGVRYYYNFTIVKTDLTESTPSGKITIRSRDTMAPDVYHTPVYNTFEGKNLVISATVTDNLQITSAKVYYRTIGETEWRSSLMNNLNDKYTAIIIGNHITMEGLEYYIEAYDGVTYSYKGSPESPFVVNVQESVDTNSLGDVNGDGVITNLDALMLLKAINDQINLDVNQFARADLDGDGVLMAKEVLRILQYVSGTVGSVDMRN